MTLRREKSSRSFSSKASLINLLDSSNWGMMMFLMALARLWVFLLSLIHISLITMEEERGIPREKCVMALFTAGAVGMVIAQKASLAGAEGGCQAECGSASAMAAAALVELAGGTPRMMGHAAAIALKNILGLVCDPVIELHAQPGGVLDHVVVGHDIAVLRNDDARSPGAALLPQRLKQLEALEKKEGKSKLDDN